MHGPGQPAAVAPRQFVGITVAEALQIYQFQHLLNFILLSVQNQENEATGK